MVHGSDERTSTHRSSDYGHGQQDRSCISTQQKPAACPQAAYTLPGAPKADPCLINDMRTAGCERNNLNKVEVITDVPFEQEWVSLGVWTALNMDLNMLLGE